MSILRLMNQPLTITKIDGSAVDAYGNQTAASLGTPTAAFGYLEQSTTTEFLNDRDVIVSQWQVFFPADTVIGAYDRVSFNGQVFEVDGAPWQVYNPRAHSVSHIQARLKVVE